MQTKTLVSDCKLVALREKKSGDRVVSHLPYNAPKLGWVSRSGG